MTAYIATHRQQLFSMLDPASGMFIWHSRQKQIGSALRHEAHRPAVGGMRYANRTARIVFTTARRPIHCGRHSASQDRSPGSISDAGQCPAVPEPARGVGYFMKAFHVGAQHLKLAQYSPFRETDRRRVPVFQHGCRFSMQAKGPISSAHPAVKAGTMITRISNVNLISPFAIWFLLSAFGDSCLYSHSTI